ncbi:MULTISPECIES: (2Fe-2S)-binding protein [Sphingomonadaceae]|uniref:(2Fe-2S)-binding protein n=1 Tax=Sphingomonadaceae TaxID=41297 RepID=UPI00115AEE52|nr:(2Fe-2S)-binding protein [Sphingomonas sp. IC081]QDK35349.1 (2Fe-2S)-binding protein [Sphingomonas sp. IC081]QSR20212.1 hypothetical protein CA833_24045 [Novosphingobium sp. KA1]
MQLQVNGQAHELEAEADMPLLWVLRDELGMTGTKYGCGLAQCGACSVLVDGVITRSCVTPLESVAGKAVTTIEAVEQDGLGKRVVDAWVRHQVPQCGYCQSGQVMAALALLKEKARPSQEDVRAAMVNLCRCGTYNAIHAALTDLAGLSDTAAAVPADGAQGGEGPSTATVAAAVAGGAAVVAGSAYLLTRRGKAGETGQGAADGQEDA